MSTAQRLIERLHLRPHPEGAVIERRIGRVKVLPTVHFPAATTARGHLAQRLLFVDCRNMLSYSSGTNGRSMALLLRRFVELLQLMPDGSGTLTTLGTDVERGMQPQAIVPQGIWQGARLAQGGKYALLGTTVAPGFEFTDFQLGYRDELLHAYAPFNDVIIALTRG